MDEYKKYWQVTPDIKISYENLFNDIKGSLSGWEAQLIWYLRNSPKGSTFDFCITAKKLYEAYQAKLALLNPLD